MVIPFLIGHLVLPLFLFILLHLIEKYERHVILHLIYMKRRKGVKNMKPVYVELDGKTRELKYTFGAMMMYEKVADSTLEQSLSNMGYNTMLAMYTAGLQHADKGITPQRVRNILEKEMEAGKTDDELFAPAIEALYRSGRLKKFYYKMFREAFDDNWNVEGSISLEELEEENDNDISLDIDGDEAKN